MCCWYNGIHNTPHNSYRVSAIDSRRRLNRFLLPLSISLSVYLVVPIPRSLSRQSIIGIYTTMAPRDYKLDGGARALFPVDSVLLFIRMTCCDNPTGYLPDRGHSRKKKKIKNIKKLPWETETIIKCVCLWVCVRVWMCADDEYAPVVDEHKLRIRPGGVKCVWMHKSNRYWT